MKKLLLTIVCLLSISIKSVAVDFFPISEVNNKHYSIGLLGGYVGYADDLSSGAFGFSGSYNIVVFLTICISYANNCFTL